MKLCASSASCAIGAVGYSLGQSKSTNHNRETDQPFNNLTSSSRHSASTLSSTSGYLSAIPRTRPATSPQPSDSHKRSSVLSGLEEEGEGHQFDSKEQSSRPQTGRTVEENYRRGSWYRRLSTVPPSVDGSVGSPSFQQPSTPSVFSNGSSATPLFGRPISTVTPRNKLVKRSTSYKGLHSEHPLDSSFASTGKGPTFRRPATSHQRSETLRLRNAQQNLTNFDETEDGHSNRWPRQRTRESTVERPPSYFEPWRPFFRYQRRKLTREAGSKRTTSSRLFGGADHITSVIPTVGEDAVLVLGNRIETPKMDHPKMIDPLMEETNCPEQNAADKTSSGPATRHSFSVESNSPVMTPWKSTRGGSLRKVKSPEDRAPAIQKMNKPSATKASTNAQDQNISSPKPPSPLPKLETLSAFEIELNRPNSSNRDSLGFDDSFGNSDIDSPEGNTLLSQRQQPNLRLRSGSRRDSRVPSDRSTVFGSDNEYSRVFSVDGDDADRRSETVYDSVRTNASGSSHSGARNYRVENVFGEHKTHEIPKQDMSTLQEKLSGISISGEKNPIVEEEESVRTPIWYHRSNEDVLATPLAGRHKNNQAGNPTDHRAGAKLNGEDLTSSDEESWDDELGIDPSARVTRNLLSSGIHDATDSVNDDPSMSDRSKSNIFEWSEPHPIERSPGNTDVRPKTSHPQQGIERGGRSSGRRANNGLHLRSQSVPLPPDSSKHKFNNAKKLDNWMLGNKGVSEDWDNDFEFDEGSSDATEAVSQIDAKARPTSGIVVPKEILERQATVHGQFGQVKELTLLVEQLRRLHHSATVYGILDGQSSELWKEAAGIIDLATLDEEDPEVLRPKSPSATSVDLDNFDDDSTIIHRRRSSNARSAREMTPQGQPSSPVDSKPSTPQNRPRNDSVARAKNVLANIHQRRDPLDPPLEIDEESMSPSKPQKMPFDTTSLRDLVTRAGVVTRACKEIIRKMEDPDYVPHTPERRPTTPPDPPFFSQIFQNSPTPSSPSSERRSPRSVERVNFATPTGDHKVHGHNISMMTVV